MMIDEIFNSIEGEGIRTGLRASFVRFKGCNLSCPYCDTEHALTPSNAKETTIEGISEQLDQFHCPNVTITGGEPLLQKDLSPLLDSLISEGYGINIETNGSIDITPYQRDGVIITMDYKLPSSRMESRMHLPNLPSLRSCDVLKFVASDDTDLRRMLEVLNQYDIRANVFLSPIFGEMDPQRLVQFLKDNNLNNVRVQLQLHKIIWSPDTRGV